MKHLKVAVGPKLPFLVISGKHMGKVGSHEGYDMNWRYVLLFPDLKSDILDSSCIAEAVISDKFFRVHDNVMVDPSNARLPMCGQIGKVVNVYRVLAVDSPCYLYGVEFENTPMIHRYWVNMLCIIE